MLGIDQPNAKQPSVGSALPPSLPGKIDASEAPCRAEPILGIDQPNAKQPSVGSALPPSLPGKIDPAGRSEEHTPVHQSHNVP